MQMRIKYTDTETQPLFKLDDNGKVEEIILDASFIIINKSAPALNKDKVIDATVGMTKKCSICGEERRLENFHKSMNNAVGCQSICITCKKKIDHDRKQKKKEAKRKKQEKKERAIVEKYMGAGYLDGKELYNADEQE